MSKNPESTILEAARELVIEKERTDAEIKRLTEINDRAVAVLSGGIAEGEVLVQRRVVTKKEKRKGRLVVAGYVIWALIIGAIIGGVFIPRYDDKPTVVQGDYSTCISNYIYENPLPDNKYQELVNALWGCNVYNQPNG